MAAHNGPDAEHVGAPLTRSQLLKDIRHGPYIPTQSDAVEDHAHIWAKTSPPCRLYFHAGVMGFPWIPVSNEIVPPVEQFTARMRFAAARPATPADYASALTPVLALSEQDGDAVMVDFDLPAAIDDDAVAELAAFHVIAWPAALPDPATLLFSDALGSFADGRSQWPLESYYTVLAGTTGIAGVAHRVAVSTFVRDIRISQAPYRLRLTWDAQGF